MNRRARRAKTDRLDALKLVPMLVRVCQGERRVWSEVRVPTVAEEAARQVSRERTALTQEQTRLINQMRGWLATWGCALPARRPDGWWTTVRDWAGAPLPAEVQARLARAERALAALAAQIAALEAQQQAAVTAAAPTSALRPTGAAERRGDDERVDVARRRPGVARVSQSARRLAGSSALRRRRIESGERRASKGSVGRAISGCRRSACSSRGIGCAGNRERADAVVSGALRRGQTRAPDRHCRGRAQAADRAVAVCHDRAWSRRARS